MRFGCWVSLLTKSVRHASSPNQRRCLREHLQVDSVASSRPFWSPLATEACFDPQPKVMRFNKSNTRRLFAILLRRGAVLSVQQNVEDYLENVPGKSIDYTASHSGYETTRWSRTWSKVMECVPVHRLGPPLRAAAATTT